MPRRLFLFAILSLLLAGCGRNALDSLSSTDNASYAATAAHRQQQLSARRASTAQAASPSAPTAVPSQVTPFVNDQAFDLLWTIHDKRLSAQEIEACLQEAPCFREHDPNSPQSLAIAQLYQLISVDERYPGPVYIRLLRGYDVPELPYLEISSFDAKRYYWAINPCATNTRLLIDARTGQAAEPAHTFVICTPMEPPFPGN
jgi:hypothetical protein